jgi:hypothetical protein
MSPDQDPDHILKEYLFSLGKHTGRQFELCAELPNDPGRPGSNDASNASWAATMESIFHDGRNLCNGM